MRSIESFFSLMNYRLFRATVKFINTSFRPKKDFFVRVDSKKMYANTLDRIFALYLWKSSRLGKHELDTMKNALKKGMVVLDIGANIGFHVLVCADSVGEVGKVYAFEPDPGNYSLLVKNIEKNNIHNVVPLEKAVTDQTGTTQLFRSEEHTGDHRVYDSEDGRKAIEVETIKIDDLFQRGETVDFVKMDIQGAEYLAFLGMENILKANPDIKIICEFSPCLLKKCSSSAEQFLKLIEHHGFKLQYIDEKKGSTVPITQENLLAMCDENILSAYTNLFLEK